MFDPQYAPDLSFNLLNQTQESNITSQIELQATKEAFLLGKEISVVYFFTNSSGELDGDGKLFNKFNSSWKDVESFLNEHLDRQIYVTKPQQNHMLH